MLNKVAVIGAGQVGATTAQRIAEKELADVVLVDIVERIAKGKSLDMLQCSPILGFDSNIQGTNNYEHLEDCKAVIITAGMPRTPGMSREELVEINSKIVADIAANIKTYAPEAIIMVVTNPLDVMTYVSYKISGFDQNKVIGMAGVLDTARYRTFLSMELGISVEDIQAMVLGGHGDHMVPLIDYTTVSGIPIRHFLSEEKINELVERTKNGGIEIVNYLQSGSAYYAPSASVVQMLEAVLKDKKRVLPCSAYLNGEYGLKDVYMGVPTVIGANGVERIIELDLDDNDLEKLQESAKVVKDNINKLSCITKREAVAV